ncbi:dihydroxyacetone kinase subunit L [Staphylococcus sp. SS87]|nr:dihydroxyacetone kinase subunit L [Staphylococcus singaporensis]MBE5675437.1 dihydroxyacetone kinase subunit L [Staphylococcus singaporensis]
MNVNDMKARLLQLEETFKTHESELTELDRAIGDGDHGVNMVRGFSSVKDKLDDSSMQALLKSTGMALMSNVGGASGPLYGFSFVKMASVAKDDMNRQDIITLIKTFAEAISARGKVTLNEKTMYDVVARAAEKLENGETLSLNQLQQLADNTKDMVATKGRAAYFGEESKGYVDPGAQSMVYVLNALIGDENNG